MLACGAGFSAHPGGAGLPPAPSLETGIEARQHFGLHGVPWERRGEEVTLAKSAAELPELLELRLGLDPFGDDLVAQRVRQPDDRGDDLARLFRLPQPGDEDLIDLQDVDREVLQ